MFKRVAINYLDTVLSPFDENYFSCLTWLDLYLLVLESFYFFFYFLVSTEGLSTSQEHSL